MGNIKAKFIIILKHQTVILHFTKSEQRQDCKKTRYKYARIFRSTLTILKK